MSVIPTVTGLSSGARLLSVPRTLAAATKAAPSSLPSLCYLKKKGYYTLRRWSILPATRKLVIRAARTESKGVSLGFRAPNFELTEPLTGKVWKLEDFEAYPALLKGLAVVAISSNSVVTHPQDGPEFMAQEATLFKYPFPYLYDESQEVARDFGAVCTPEFFLFKKDGRRPFELVYHGQFDDSRPSNNVPVTGRDLSLAIDRVLSGQLIPSTQKPSIGCSIKWNPGGKQ